MTDRAAINGNLQQWNITASAACPACGQAESTRWHLIQCTDRRMEQKWETCIQNLDIWLQQNHTQPELRAGLIQGIQTIKTNQVWQQPRSTWPGVPDALQQQQALGWKNTFDGFICNEWEEAQQTYLIWLNRRTTGKRWVSRLIRKLMEVAWDMWRQRQKIANEPMSEHTHDIHARLDEAIEHWYEEYAHSPIPTLARFFQRHPHELKLQPLEYKQQWVDHIQLAVPLLT